MDPDLQFQFTVFLYMSGQIFGKKTIETIKVFKNACIIVALNDNN